MVVVISRMKKRIYFCGTGLGFLVKNRSPGRRKTAHGGVVVVYRESSCNLKPINLPNPDNFEVQLPVAGTVKGQARKLVLVACYIPTLLPGIKSEELS